MRYLPLPPFSKRLDEFLSAGNHPENDVFIFCGNNAWEKASALHKRLFVICLPLNEHPKKFRWPVRNCSVLIFHSGGLNAQQLEEFVYFLFVSGATIVHVDQMHTKLFVYRKETIHE